ncbi:hypothetical protein GCM10027176_21360 [Actinoallomurus bryophytorum]|uniref:Galactose oxidase-like protein n=1 Tax=Actinoallomurus bryophytorum TaxID=1490222 RepID=A0A543CKG3_9ACTN|nr:hypothetical protein [Actinoallomurus bryophytorum]TQL97594.1 hypothetical protein FB559_3189 [Actinoallomurus bryophytorum]
MNINKRRIAAAAIPAMLITASSATPDASAAVTHASRADVTVGADWHLYDVPVTGNASLDDVVAPGRDDAWAAGATLDLGTGQSAPPPTPSTGPDRWRAGSAGPEGRRHVAASDGTCEEAGFADSLMLHWDGHTWRRTTVPDVGIIGRLSAGSSTDVWASASCGLLHWDGRDWTSVPYAPVPGAAQASAGPVTADGAGDAWLVGHTYDPRTGDGSGFVQRWDGARWRLVPTPDIGGTDDDFEAVSAYGPDDVWVAGTDYTGDDLDPAQPETLILLHWDGHAWTRFPDPGTGEWTQRVTRVLTLPTGAWVAGWGKRNPSGEEIRRPLILRWDGHRWLNTAVPDGPGEVMDIASDGRTLWAVGDTFLPTDVSGDAYALQWSGDRWVAASVPIRGEGATLSGAASIPGGGLWTVGAVDPTGTNQPYALIARHG